MSQVMAAKVKELARLMMISRKTVAYTGAGGVSGHPGDVTVGIRTIGGWDLLEVRKLRSKLICASCSIEALKKTQKTTTTCWNMLDDFTTFGPLIFSIWLVCLCCQAFLLQWLAKRRWVDSIPWDGRQILGQRHPPSRITPWVSLAPGLRGNFFVVACLICFFLPY